MEHIELTEIEKQHASIIRSGLHECSLFLRKNFAFPLQNPCKLAIFGNGARHTFKGGTGSGDVNSRYIVSAEEGFENAGFTITTKSYLDAYDLVIKQSDKQFVKDVKASAKRKHVSVYMEAFGFTKLQPDYDIPLVYDSDAAIYVLSRLCGEGNDRQVAKGDFYLTDTEVREILELNDKYEKFMLVLNVGGVVDLSPVKNVSNILLLSQLGSEIGNCLADIVLGKVNPSGKLSDSWADYKSYNPDAIFDEVNDTKYNEGLYFGYRYFDSYNKEPLFPFGFGLSYSEFEILHPKLEVHSLNVSVSFDVKNISKVSGKEVVQLYVREPQGRLGKPYQKLVGFIKTPLLKESESCSLSINMNVEDIVSFDIENSCYLLEKGQYVFKLGNSSRNTKTIGAIELKEDIVTKKVKILYPNNVKSTSIKIEDEKVDKPITIKSNVVPEVTEYKDFISPLCKNYSDEEIVNLLIGGKRDDGLLSFIGNAAMKVVGAAGESYHNVKDIPGFVFSDGPAGLRISQRVGVKGNKMRDLSANMMMATVYPFFPFIAKPIMKGFLKEKKLKKDETLLTQYCTAIPIGTALAQSWNIEYAQLCGDIVGKEMEQHGVDFWLAPGMNIHRNVLCGRNFEYFSEDPLLAGLIASGITKGVQSHKNKFVTLKHFACNNQEMNRFYNNSVVDERTLREIYLKPFEITIKEANAMGVMSSYNLVNGKHTNESAELINDYLRNEANFKGIVMTDWIMTTTPPVNGSVYPATDVTKVIKANTQLFMPGSGNHFKQALASVKSGDISRYELERAVSPFLELIQNLK